MQQKKLSKLVKSNRSVQDTCKALNFNFTQHKLSGSENSFLLKFALLLMYWDNAVYLIKGALSGLIKFLATESPLKIMEITFYLTIKALFVPKIFKLLS